MYWVHGFIPPRKFGWCSAVDRQTWHTFDFNCIDSEGVKEGQPTRNFLLGSQFQNFFINWLLEIPNSSQMCQAYFTQPTVHVLWCSHWSEHNGQWMYVKLVTKQMTDTSHHYNSTRYYHLGQLISEQLQSFINIYK